MGIWRWQYRRKVSVDQYGIPTYEIVAKGELDVANDDAAKSQATRLVKKHDPTIKAYPDKWRTAWNPAIEQFAVARDMHFTAFTKSPLYTSIGARESQDPDWMEELRIEKL